MRATGGDVAVGIRAAGPGGYLYPFLKPAGLVARRRAHGAAGVKRKPPPAATTPVIIL